METFGIFVKHPATGQVKTRLAEAIGPEQATALYVAFLADLTARFARLPARRVLGFTPAEPAAEQYFRNLASQSWTLWPQPATDLGSRMAAFFETHLSEPRDRVVLIGSDSPTLPEELVHDAFAELLTADCVLGPATDGGYYLVGLRGTVRATQKIAPLFAGIDWSTPSVLAQTAERIRTLGLTLRLLPPWYDVDTPQDLAILRGHLAALAVAASPLNVRETRQCLASVIGS